MRASSPVSQRDQDPQALAESARKARIVYARKDVNTFMEFVLRDEYTGGPVEQAACHIAWQDTCDEFDHVVLYAHRESGKAVPLNTPIPTPGGWTSMGELRIGSAVFGSDGLPYKVTWCSPIQYNRDVYEIMFDDGATEIADADHNWLAWSVDDLRGRGKGAPRVVTTKDMLKRLYRSASKSRQEPKWRIPVTAPVQYPEANLPIHPYVLGAWLGDGAAACARIFVHEKDRIIAERCIALEGGKSGRWLRDKRNSNAVSINICGDSDKHTSRDPMRLRARLRNVGVLGNKHIPTQYLVASESQRRELLAGLIDTDGYVSGDGKGRVEFTTTRQVLAEGVVELVRSLGFTVTCKASKAKLYGKTTGTRWRIMWTPHEAVCRLPRKLARQRLDNDRRWVRHRAIIKIRKIVSCPVKCITVASPDHTYLLGRSYTVTHNTNQIAIGRPLYVLGRDPNTRIAIVSNTYHQAEKNVRTIAGYIARSDKLHMVFPNLLPGEPWTSSQITIKSDSLKRDPSVQAVGVHGNILGARLDLVILDDVLDFENTQTPRQRQDLWDWYHATITGMLTQNARVIVIGTAWHPEDMLHRFVKQPHWKALKYPVEDEKGRPLWPERWPKDRIDTKRVELGPLEFARQMMCQARDDSQSRFSTEWINACLEAGSECQVANSARDFFQKHPQLFMPEWINDEDDPFESQSAQDTIERMGLLGRFYTGVDIAVQQHSDADETVLFTIYVHPDGRRQVAEIAAGKWSGPTIVSKIINVHERFGSIIVVENNSSQDFVLQFARDRDVVLPLLPFTTGRNKMDPAFGIESIAAEMANAKWIIPSVGGVSVDPQISLWIQEMLYYSPRAHTGDRLMSSWFVRELARRATMVSSTMSIRMVG